MEINCTFFILATLLLVVPGYFMQPTTYYLINSEDANNRDGLSLLKHTNPVESRYRYTRDVNSTKINSENGGSNNLCAEPVVEETGFLKSMFSKVWHGWQLIFRQVFHGIPIEAPDDVSKGRKCVNVANGEVINKGGLEKTVRSITNNFKDDFEIVFTNISSDLGKKEKRDVNENKISNRDVEMFDPPSNY